MAIANKEKEVSQYLLKLLEGYIDSVQAAMAIKDYREIESSTDNTCAILNKLKMRYELK